MARLFGTDGVRGVANTELDSALAFKLGQAGALVLTENCKTAPRILVGRDTRISGDMLEAALSAGFCSVGAQVVSVGIIPTPAVAYLVRKYKMDAGVVISASHNSMEYNGIKFFGGEGYKLSDDTEDKIEEYVTGKKEMPPLKSGAALGKITRTHTGLRDYVDFVKSTANTNFAGLKIAVDCANGASYESVKLVLKELGADVEIINNIPNGININDNCGSTHMDGICKFTKEHNCDLGLALDGDADRLLAVDENGNPVDGDKIMAVCASYLKKHGKLSGNKVVATVMSNLGFFNALDSMGIGYEQTKVGDRYVLENMLKNGYSIGGEQSGHIIFLEHNTTGDGLVTAVQLICALKESQKKMSDFVSVVKILPQVLVNAKIKNEYKTTYMNVKEIADAIESIESRFNGSGRVLIRPSGTEPLVRVMIEGTDIDELNDAAHSLANLIEEKLG